MCPSSESPASCYQAIQAVAGHQCPNPDPNLSPMAPAVAAAAGDLHKPWGSACAAPPPLLSAPQRPRARRRVLYPPLVRRVMPKERPDLARRWLMLLSALVFLQIYTEEAACTCPCTAKMWDPLQAEGGAASCMTPVTSSGPQLPECEAPGEELLDGESWGGCGACGEMELDVDLEAEQCSEMCVSLPARVQSLMA